MNIILMERKTLDGKPVEYGADENGEDYRDWWCVLETLEEEWIYKQFVHETASNTQSQRLINLWNSLVKHAGQKNGIEVTWGNDDIYGYIKPNETAPLITEPFIDGDGDEWIRIQ